MRQARDRSSDSSGDETKRVPTRGFADFVRRTSSVTLFALAGLTGSAPYLSEASAIQGKTPTVQFCRSQGRFDDTIYYAEVEEREDRKDSFAALVEISGIETDAVNCIRRAQGEHLIEKQNAMSSWTASRFEIIDTMFLSDLDY